jgi:hypothetical protein
MENLKLATYCHIKNNRVFLDGHLLFKVGKELTIKNFLTKAFRHFKFKYPKFFKMDEISKLGFLAAELLLQQKTSQTLGESVGIVLSNSQSTLVTDTTFQQSINNPDEFFPSPSVFVYTLPNIMIGEISIRHKFMGENAFFIFDRFNAEFITEYINLLFSTDKINHCIGGWVDQSGDDYEAFMYLVSNEPDQTKTIDHSAGNIRNLYELI